MATVTPKSLADGVLVGIADTTIYTAPASTTAVIRSITLCNVDSVTRTVDVHIVQSGGGVAAGKRIIDATSSGSLTAGQTLVLDNIYVLETGDIVSAIASAASAISIRIDGSEVT